MYPRSLLLTWFQGFLAQLARDPSLCVSSVYASRITGDVLTLSPTK